MLRGVTDLRYRLVLACLLTIASLRIVSTYSVFTQTYDEPAHIAAGMEWLDRGTYRYDPQHTPIARIAVALGPYLRGIRSFGLPDMWQEGNAILAANGTYRQNLTAARLGILPFFLLAGIAIWTFASRWFDPPTALLAVGLFSFLPPVLAHAGLATTDMAATATFFVAISVFLAWLQDPSLKRSAALGLVAAVAVLARLSSLPMLVLSFVILLAVFLSCRPRRHQLHISRSAAFACAGTLLLTILATYQFRVTPVLDPAELSRARSLGFGIASDASMRDLQYQLAATPIPASPLLRGLYRGYEHNALGHDSYLLGEYRNRGWWYFFLVVLAVKTPIAFLLLAAFGLVLLLADLSKGLWIRPAVALTSFAILLVCSVSNINLGVRHLLPIYPFLAIAAALGAITLWRAPRWNAFARSVVVALLGWFATASISAHPDYLPYFNELAARAPERFLAGSDLDWGQDLQRLSIRCKELKIPALTIRYAGTADLTGAGLPAFHILAPYQPTSGYIAISLRFLTLEDAKARALGNSEGPYAWLKRHQPVEKIGASILLYNLSPSSL